MDETSVVEKRRTKWIGSGLGDVFTANFNTENM